MATKLTKERIEFLLKPGRVFQDNGTILFLGTITEEEREDISAAYRVGFLKQDIDSVITEVNSGRGFNKPKKIAAKPAPKPKNKTLADIFGHTTLKDVSVNINGVEIRIGSVELL